MTHDSACITSEQHQQIEFFRGEMHFFTSYEHPMCFYVDGETAFHNGGGLGLLLRTAPQLGAYAGKKLRCAERFDHIIVSATVKRSNFGRFLFTHGKDNDGSIRNGCVSP